MSRIPVPITVTDTSGNSLSGATVRVQQRASGSNAVLYSTESGPTTVNNPTSTDVAGRVNVWVEDGPYLATVSGTGFTSYQQSFGTSFPTAGATLPLNPVDGQEFWYKYNDSVSWQFRYDAASSSAYKWKFVGGPWARMSDAGIGAFSTANTPAAALSVINVAGNDQRFTAPFAGDYAVSGVSNVQLQAAGTQAVYLFALPSNGVAAGNTSAVIGGNTFQTGLANSDGVCTGMSANGKIDFKAFTQYSAPIIAATSWIKVQPLRIG